MMVKKIKKAVIPAAGLGTRFLPASKVVPKELFTVVDRPILQYIVDEAVTAGVEEIILVVSPRKKRLAEYFADDPDLERFLEEKGQTSILVRLHESHVPVRITVVVQEDPKGLGHAVMMAKEAVGDEPFAVLLPDDLILAEDSCLEQMFPVWAKYQQGCVAVRRVSSNRVDQYGIVEVETGEHRAHRMKSVVEKPPVKEAPSDLAVIGRYLLPPSIFEILEGLSPGAGGEIQLTDALQTLLERDGLFAFEFEGDHFDAGHPVGFISANVAYGLARDDFEPELASFLGGMRES